MHIERTKNASRNIVFGMVNRVVTLVAPFIVRTILIYQLGVEYVGLSSLFISILSILNMAELGVSSAIVYSMYGAIAEDDTDLICALMNFYRKAYGAIGCIILAIGISIAPFLRHLISGDVPADVNIYVLYFIFLSQTCLTYFLFAYKACLFTAFQRSDVINNVATMVSICLYASQAGLLLAFNSYYLYVIVLPISTIANNLILSLIANKQYPKYKPLGSLDDDIISEIYRKVRSLFLYKLGSVVLISVDTVVISAFLGLTTLGKYNNYYMIITVLFGFLAVINSSLTAGVGNSLKVESKDKNYKDFKRLFIINAWIVSWCTTCLVCICQPFMQLWIGKDYMFPFMVVALFGLYFFSWRMMDVVNLFKDAGGLWEYDKFRPLVAAIINLTINLILVQIIGIYGVIISTIISIVMVIFPWSSFILFKYMFNDNTKTDWINYVGKVIYALFVCAVVTFITYWITMAIPQISLVGLAIKIIICMIVPNILYLFLFSFYKDFSDTTKWLIARCNYLFGGLKKQ